MSRDIFNVWKEAAFSGPIYRDAFKSMYLGVLQDASMDRSNDQLSVIRYQVQDLVLCESKGRLSDVTSFVLPSPGSESLWLCLQLNGQTVFPGGRTIEPDDLCVFRVNDGEIRLTISSQKYWALFLGLSAASMHQFLSEFSSFRVHFDRVQHDILPAVSISYTERQALENFNKMTFGPFSTVHHIGHLFMKLYGNYLKRLTDYAQRPTEEPQIQLYHRAVAYIQDNYTERALNRETIAEALYCSMRSLSRAFEGRTLSLNATILTIRLYKARELLVQQPDLSVEQIAIMLYFFDTSHFTAQYKKLFHLTPRQERKNLEFGKK